MRTHSLIPAILILIWISGCELLGQNEVYELTVDVNDPVRGTAAPANRQFEEGAKVTLEAEVRSFYRDGFRFGWWIGDVSGEENPLTFTIRGDTEVVAVFRRKEHALTVLSEGQGEVEHQLAEDSDAGVAIDFPDLYDYQHGASIRLEAFPAPGWQFCRWRGETFTYNRNANPTQEHPRIWEDATITARFLPLNQSCSDLS